MARELRLGRHSRGYRMETQRMENEKEMENTVA